MSECLRCFNRGTYTDPACLGGTCAHSEKEVLTWKTVKQTNSFGILKEKQVPDKLGDVAMDCPTRTCLCPAGRTRKRQFTQKGAKQ